jgi:ferritin
MTTDYNNPPEYKISWEECDKIAAHTLKYYKHLTSEIKDVHLDDVKYNKKLHKSIDFILKYLGEDIE